MDLYLKNALQCSKDTTLNYSTSFSLGVRLLDKSVRDAIYAIYGYVRFADEIVDTFFDFEQETMFKNFREQTFVAIEEKISTNPIIHSFQWVVNTYSIDMGLIEAFLNSMEMDLSETVYDEQSYKNYIYGSAEVVGLMCLKVFCHGNVELYCDLYRPARKLGEAFQKVNFLRDMEDDFEDRGRTYFPNIDFSSFNETQKKEIEADIKRDFNESLTGMAKLPLKTRFGVYLAYSYYRELLKKISKTPAEKLMQTRIRVPNSSKFLMLISSFTRFKISGGNIPKPDHSEETNSIMAGIIT